MTCWDKGSRVAHPKPIGAQRLSPIEARPPDECDAFVKAVGWHGHLALQKQPTGWLDRIDMIYKMGTKREPGADPYPVDPVDPVQFTMFRWFRSLCAIIPSKPCFDGAMPARILPDPTGPLAVPGH